MKTRTFNKVFDVLLESRSKIHALHSVLKLPEHCLKISFGAAAVKKAKETNVQAHMQRFLTEVIAANFKGPEPERTRLAFSTYAPVDFNGSRKVDLKDVFPAFTSSQLKEVKAELQKIGFALKRNQIVGCHRSVYMLP